MGLNELNDFLKDKKNQEYDEQYQQMVEIFRNQLNEQTAAEYENYKAKSRRDPNACIIMFTEPLED